MSFTLRWRAALAGRAGGGAMLTGARQALTSLREFFRHHGIWAPGVRLHRRLDFRAKAAIVATVFVVPTALLAWLQFSSAWQGLQGLRHAQQMLQLSLSSIGLAQAVDRQRSSIYNAAALTPAAQAQTLAGIESGWRSVEAAYPRDTGARAVAARYRAVVEQLPFVTGPRVGERAVQVGAHTAFIERLHNFNEVLVTDTPLGKSDTAAFQHRAHLALHLLPRLEQALGVTWARATLLARQAEPGVAAYEAYASAFHPLNQLIERARSDALALESGPAPGSPAGVAGRVVRALDQSHAHALKVHRLVLAGAAAADIDGERPAMHAHRLVLRDLFVELGAALEAELDQRWTDQRNAFAIFCTVLLVGLGLANYILFAFFHVLRGGMRQIQREVQYVAEGDLSRRPQPLGRDEAAHTLRLITESLGNLGGLFSVVRRGVASVAHASTEIATASTDLARGSTQALNSVASVREGIGAMVGHLEGYEQCVQQAVERARAMRTESGRSRRVMGTLSERIAGLQQRSREIGKIVGMIDGIAFQTHLLSLNASVEAARAGEAGKGFAVVAHEVRQLSMRVGHAAQQIGDIVAASIAEIEQGRAITQHTVEAVLGTEAEVHGVNKVLQRLTELTCEGQQNAQQMAGSLDELHQFSDSNARLAEQMTAAAQELRRQSLQVSEQSGRFKLA
jgi:methyl-accepting chemotaxis protein